MPLETLEALRNKHSGKGVGQTTQTAQNGSQQLSEHVFGEISPVLLDPSDSSGTVASWKLLFCGW